MKKSIYSGKLIFILLIILGNNENMHSQWTLSYNESGNCFTSVGTDMYLGTWFTGVHRSTDFGLTWPTAGFPYPRHVISMTSNSYGIFAGTDSYGIYVSTNGGAPWYLSNSGLSHLFINVLFSSADVVYAGYIGVFVSTNNGSMWTQRDSGLTSLDIHSFAANIDFVFVGTSGGVCLSSNNGTTWNPINNGLTNLTVTALAAKGQNLFAGTMGGGVFYSSNNGTLWTPVNNGLQFQSIGALAISNNNIFAGTFSGGVYFSSNNGQSWTPRNEGMVVGEYFKSLIVANNYIFAGIDNSVWRRQLSEITGIQSSNTGIPKTFFLSQNYPNPFNPSTKISYDLPSAVIVKLVVYDMLGREVKTLVNEKQNAGRYEIVFDASNYPSGVYYYKLSTGDNSNTKKMVLIK